MGLGNLLWWLKKRHLTGLSVKTDALFTVTFESNSMYHFLSPL